MKECCANCGRRLRLEKLDYSQGGCFHTMLEGFVCTAFANEGVANWMIGIDLDTGICEEFTPRGTKKHV